MAENEEELKSLLIKVKKESEKAGLTLNIPKTYPITLWQIDGEKTETVTDLIFLASKIIAYVTAAMESKDTCFLEEKLWPT